MPGECMCVCARVPWGMLRGRTGEQGEDPSLGPPASAGAASSRLVPMAALGGGPRIPGVGIAQGRPCWLLPASSAGSGTEAGLQACPAFDETRALPPGRSKSVGSAASLSYRRAAEAQTKVPTHPANTYLLYQKGFKLLKKGKES